MDINKLLNVVLPPLTLLVVIFLWPVFLLWKIFSFLKTSLQKENLAGKVALITGASSGIGEHLAYEYARGGACLALVARRGDRLRAVADKALQLGSPGVISVAADVSKMEDCKRFVDQTVKHFGKLDHLVTNAGVTEVKLFEENGNMDSLATIMGINFFGSVHATHFAIPFLRKSKGKIVVMSSSVGWLSLPRQSIYDASKAALISFYEALRIELGTEIGITIVTPGMVKSEMTEGEFRFQTKLEFVQSEQTETCAKAIVESVRRGAKYLTEPSWVRLLFHLKRFFPEPYESICRWIFVGNGSCNGNEASEAYGNGMLMDNNQSDRVASTTCTPNSSSNCIIT